MNLLIIGLGTVGLVNALGWAEVGCRVIGYDNNINKVNKLKQKKLDIYEPGFTELLNNNINNGRLLFTDNLKDINLDFDIIFICVATYVNNNTSLLNLTNILNELKQYSQVANNKLLISISSTVKVNTMSSLQQKFKENFELTYHPEFIANGQAVEDFFNNPQQVIGIDSTQHTSEKSYIIINKLYNLLPQKIILKFVSYKKAELIKLARNAYVATRVSLANQINDLFSNHNETSEEFFDIINNERYNLHPNATGFGGSCLPKDTKSLLATASQSNINCSLINLALDYNIELREKIFNKILKLFDGNLANKKIAIIGLAFKKYTSDVRESMAMFLINKLLNYNCCITGTDLFAIKAMQVFYPEVKYYNNVYDTCYQSDLAIFLLDYPEYKNLDYTAIINNMRANNIFALCKLEINQETMVT